MIYQVFDLKDKNPALSMSTPVHVYCPDNFDEFSKGVKRKTVVVIPGGGYSYCSNRENEPIALSLLAHDYNAFCINYACTSDIEFPYPMLQVFALVAYIRQHAEEYNVDINNIYVMGFSAGGHLAASSACYFIDPKFASMLNVKPEDIKINGCILAYPVITMKEDETHIGTMENITEGRKPELMDYFSIEKHVSRSFPKTFIYETEEDVVVPPINTYKLVDALKSQGIECKVDLFPKGIHGTSLCTEQVYYGQPRSFIEEIKLNSKWIDHMVNFFNGREDY